MSRHPLPMLWLLSDERNDAQLERALERLPHASGFVFRHYHLQGDARRERFAELRELAHAHDHIAILSDTIEEARALSADGVYGSVDRLGLPGQFLRLATAHNGEELRAAATTQADGVFLSPVFPTRSHPGAKTLGVLGFHVLAQQVALPVIALGGMTKERAGLLDWPRWAAIDGLV